jgi:uncharacterized protein YjgD (DUF1641 family)
LKDIADTDESIEQLTKYLADLERQKSEINKLANDYQNCYLFEVNTTEIKKEFTKTIIDHQNYLLEKIYDHVEKRLEKINMAYNEIKETLKKTPEEEGEWVTLKSFIKDYNKRLIQLAAE